MLQGVYFNRFSVRRWGFYQILAQCGHVPSQLQQRLKQQPFDQNHPAPSPPSLMALSQHENARNKLASSIQSCTPALVLLKCKKNQKKKQTFKKIFLHRPAFPNCRSRLVNGTCKRQNSTNQSNAH
jgi:hypothetical protein